MEDPDNPALDNPVLIIEDCGETYEYEEFTITHHAPAPVNVGDRDTPGMYKPQDAIKITLTTEIPSAPWIYSKEVEISSPSPAKRDTIVEFSCEPFVSSQTIASEEVPISDVELESNDFSHVAL